MSVSDRSSKWWVSSPPSWKACTFSGLGVKKQAYFDLLTEKMAKLGFQRVEALEVGSLITPRAPYINKESDLIFKSSSRKLCVGVKISSKNGDLRVGFKQMYYSVAMFALLIAFGFFLGFVVFSIYIQIYGPMSSSAPKILELLMGLSAIGVLISPLILFGGVPFLIWRQRLKKILIKTAESLGSKQTTPFEKTFGTLEKWRPSRSEQFVKAFGIIAIVFIIIAVILSIIL